MNKNINWKRIALYGIFIAAFCFIKFKNHNSKIEQNQQEIVQIVESEAEKPVAEQGPRIVEDGSYNSKEDVALYIQSFNHLPSNYITKKQASALGWQGGSLEEFAPGKSIGGDRFGNYEKKLPDKQGRNYTECDIDTLGKKSRGTKRIIFSNDGLIFYTDNHYESFEKLFGTE